MFSSLSDSATDGCNIGEKQAHLKDLFALANMALEQGKLGLDEGFIDATLLGKKGVLW